MSSYDAIGYSRDFNTNSAEKYQRLTCLPITRWSRSTTRRSDRLWRKRSDWVGSGRRLVEARLQGRQVSTEAVEPSHGLHRLGKAGESAERPSAGRAWRSEVGARIRDNLAYDESDPPYQTTTSHRRPTGRGRRYFCESLRLCVVGLPALESDLIAVVGSLRDIGRVPCEQSERGPTLLAPI